MTMRAGLAILWFAALGAPLCALAARPAEFKFVPDYEARLLGEDRLLTIATLRGEVLLLNTFATWCGPCRAEMPGIEAIYKRYKARGFSVVAVSIDEGAADDEVMNYVRALGLSFPVLRDPTNRFAKRYKVLGVPESFLIGRDGRLIKRWRGEVNFESATSRKLIETALAEPAPVPLNAIGKPQEHQAHHKPTNASTTARGKRLAEQRGCFACHSLDGSIGVGPTLQGLAGAKVTLADGRTVVRDKAYLERAVSAPDAELVAGYPAGLMANGIPGKPLTAMEIEALVAYLESLASDAPVRSSP